MPQDKPKEPNPKPGPRPSDKPKDPKGPKEPTPKPNTLSQEAFEEPIVDETSILSGSVLSATASSEEVRVALARRLPEVEVFWDRDFKGESWRTTFGYSFVGSHWNDEISSIIVYSGYVEFFEHRDYGGASKILGPGQYAFVGDVGIANDTISSWKTYYGD